MKVLLAEDSAQKIARFRAFLGETEGLGGCELEVAQSVQDARQLLRTNAYDLLVLDVLLPQRPGDTPAHTGTLGLLEELTSRNTLQKPRQIVGLTAFDDALKEAGPAFQQRTWTVIKFEFASDEWKGQLGACIRWMREQEKQARPAEYDADLCIVTALQEPEMGAVLRLPWNWQPAEPIDDIQFVRRGRFICNGREFSVVLASASKMGMVHSALLAAKVIQRERPRFIVMAGMCAGLRDKTNYGDILLADPSWDWQAGKHFVDEETHEFAIAPDPLGPSSFIRSRFDLLRADVAHWSMVKSLFPATPDSELKVRIGPVASGSSVLADTEIVDRIKGQNRQLIGVEMEAFAVMSAASEACHPRPTAFSVKSVCDFGDEKKDDRWQAYAAYTSAEAIKVFFERYMEDIWELAGTR